MELLEEVAFMLLGTTSCVLAVEEEDGQNFRHNSLSWMKVLCSLGAEFAGSSSPSSCALIKGASCSSASWISLDLFAIDGL